ncbi:MAG: hypothetical protein KTR25_14370 [Myxococcales bacterium]|nr:hypothetical protein [Myxococcales bacterium]
MACTFSINLPGTPDELVQKARQMICDAKGSFEGNVANGTYSVKLPVGGAIEGKYDIDGGSITFTITKKPMLVPCSTIESFLRSQFSKA